jgi:hypothetical protein
MSTVVGSSAASSLGSFAFEDVRKINKPQSVGNILLNPSQLLRWDWLQNMGLLPFSIPVKKYLLAFNARLNANRHYPLSLLVMIIEPVHSLKCIPGPGFNALFV